jgi:hypothetical protein
METKYKYKGIIIGESDEGYYFYNPNKCSNDPFYYNDKTESKKGRKDLRNPSIKELTDEEFETIINKLKCEHLIKYNSGKDIRYLSENYDCFDYQNCISVGFKRKDNFNVEEEIKRIKKEMSHSYYYLDIHEVNHSIDKIIRERILNQ